MAYEKAVFKGYRMYRKHTAIITKWAKRLKTSDSNVVRRALEDFKPKI